MSLVQITMFAILSKIDILTKVKFINVVFQVTIVKKNWNYVKINNFRLKR